MAAKGDRTRRQIQDVLRELLHEKGYDGTSVAEVTRRTGLTRPAFYFHFESLGAAIASLMEDFLERSFAVEAGWLEHQGTDQIANLRYGIEHTVRLWRKDPVIMDAMARAATSDPAARRIWHRWIRLFRERVRPVVRADTTGLTDDECDHLSDLLTGSIFDAMARDVRHIVDGGTPDLRLAASLATLWSRAIYR